MVIDNIYLSTMNDEHIIRNTFQTQNVPLPTAGQHTDCSLPWIMAHLWTESAGASCVTLNHRSTHLHLTPLLCGVCPAWTVCAGVCYP